MEILTELTDEEINALGNDGYRLDDARPATAADELPFGVNTLVLTFKADGKEDLEYSAKVNAASMDVIAACVCKEPVEVFVALWNMEKDYSNTAAVYQTESA